VGCANDSAEERKEEKVQEGAVTDANRTSQDSKKKKGRKTRKKRPTSSSYSYRLSSGRGRKRDDLGRSDHQERKCSRGEKEVVQSGKGRESAEQCRSLAVLIL